MRNLFNVEFATGAVSDYTFPRHETAAYSSALAPLTGAFSFVSCRFRDGILISSTQKSEPESEKASQHLPPAPPPVFRTICNAMSLLGKHQRIFANADVKSKNLCVCVCVCVLCAVSFVCARVMPVKSNKCQNTQETLDVGSKGALSALLQHGRHSQRRGKIDVENPHYYRLFLFPLLQHSICH